MLARVLSGGRAAGGADSSASHRRPRRRRSRLPARSPTPPPIPMRRMRCSIANGFIWLMVPAALAAVWLAWRRVLPSRWPQVSSRWPVGWGSALATQDALIAQAGHPACTTAPSGRTGDRLVDGRRGGRLHDPVRDRPRRGDGVAWRGPLATRRPHAGDTHDRPAFSPQLDHWTRPNPLALPWGLAPHRVRCRGCRTAVDLPCLSADGALPGKPDSRRARRPRAAAAARDRGSRSHRGVVPRLSGLVAGRATQSTWRSSTVLPVAGLAIVTTMGIVRYGLFDLRVALNRTLVLTAH